MTSITKPAPVKVSESPDTLPPHSLEAEEAVLGACLYDDQIFRQIKDILDPSDFFIVANEWVYEAMCAVHERGDFIDNLTVIEQLRVESATKNDSRLTAIGGSARITYLLNSCDLPWHGEVYARLIKAMSIRRKILAGAGDMAQVALELNAELPDILSKCQAIANDVLNVKTGVVFEVIGEVASQIYDQAEERFVQGTQTLVYTTGLSELDKALDGGLQNGDLITLAADTGNGKTAMALQIAAHVASEGHRVLYFSREMNAVRLTSRIMSMNSGLSSTKIVRGTIANTDIETLTDTLAKLSGLPFWMDCTSPDRYAIQGSARRFAGLSSDPLALIVIDYIQRFRPDNMPISDNGERLMIADMTWALKSLAQELNCPVLALTQVNTVTSGKDIELDNLFGSGAIKRDSDVVIALNWPKDSSTRSQPKVPVRPVFLKNRNGVSGITVPGISFIGSCTCFIQDNTQ